MKHHAEALRRAGITEEDMEGVPSVTSRIRKAVGSIDLAIEALSGDDSPRAIAFMEKYNSLSKTDKIVLSIEDIFTAAGLSARDFIEVLTGALMQQSADVTKMLVSAAQPKVVDATIQAAITRQPIINKKGEIVGETMGDIKAQEIFHRATGFLPTPKSAQTTINLQQLNQTANNSRNEGPCDPPESMDDFLLDMQDVVKGRILPAPAPDSSSPKNAPEIEYLDVEA